MRLVFATRNPGKVVELRALLSELSLDVVGVADLDDDIPEVVEDGDTFAANAVKKAMEVCRASGLPALADDSGLEVDALGGEPGVSSARYAGPGATDEANNEKLLRRLEGVPPGERTARFRAVVALALPGGEIATAEGACEGRILEAPRGDGGFGYDPLFYCPELGMTFAEAGTGEKGGVSHRARAVRALLPRLREAFGAGKTP